MTTTKSLSLKNTLLPAVEEIISEIVVPVIKNGAFVAQIDVDSNQKNSITEEQKELLEKICTLLSNEF